MTYDQVKAMALEYPGVEAETSYGTPGLRVAGKFLARLKEDGETLVLKVDPFEKDMLLESRSDICFTTDHYRGHPSVLIRLPVISDEDMADLLDDAWRANAPKRLVAQRPAG